MKKNKSVVFGIQELKEEIGNPMIHIQIHIIEGVETILTLDGVTTMIIREGN